MLLLALSWLIAYLTLGIAGGWTLWALGRAAFPGPNEATAHEGGGRLVGSVGAVLQIFTGLAALTGLAAIATLLGPLTPLVRAGLILAPCLALAFAGRSLQGQILAPLRAPMAGGPGGPAGRAVAWGLFGATALICLIKAAGPTEVFDDGYAHLHVLRSIEEVGTLIGLGNLHPNLAYNTHTYLSTLLVATPGLEGADRALYRLGAWMGALLALEAGAAAGRLIEGRPRPADLMAALLPALYLRSQLAGNSTDMPMALLWWAMVLYALSPAVRAALGGPSNHALDRVSPAERAGVAGWLATGLLLPLFAPTFKLTGLAALALPAGLLGYALWPKSPLYPYRGRVLALGVGLGVFFLVPWGVRNVLYTGYPHILLHRIGDPLAKALDWDWRMPHHLIDRLAVQVRGNIFHEPKELSLGWAKRYWAAVPGNGRLLLALGALSTLALIALLASGAGVLGKGARRALALPGALAVASATAGGLGLWALSASEPRYGHLWLVPWALLPLSWALAWLMSRGMTWLKPPMAPWVMLIPTVAATAVLALTLGALGRTLREGRGTIAGTLVTPAGRPVVAWETLQGGRGLTLHRPTRYLTAPEDSMRIPPVYRPIIVDSLAALWDTPVPGLYQADEAAVLEARGKTLLSGIRRTDHGGE